MLYRSKMSHGKNKKNFQVFDPLEFIAAITQHIPEKSFQLVRYYGWYSNRIPGDRKKQEQTAQGHDQTVDDEIIDIRSCKPRRIPPLMWRECIKKIWDMPRQLHLLTIHLWDGQKLLILFTLIEENLSKFWDSGVSRE